MSDSPIGTFIGEYEIIGQIGVGGMGVVYRARQFNLMREVALKLLPKEYARDSEYIERFLREARAAARLNHPNIVQVYDAGVFEGQYFFVMELVQGKNVGEIIRQENRVSERDAIRIILQAGLGLSFAHHSGIIHRDVKPENLIMDAEGTIKICDLGLARWGASVADKRITQSGMTIGTPHYIAPEQVKGLVVDHRADIYSLGATFYHVLTKHQPFEGQNPAEIMLSHLKNPIPDPRVIFSDISEEAVQFLNRMTEKSVEKRFQSMDEVVDAACAIIGAQEVQGMVSPEVAKRLAQRFMERRGRVSTSLRTLQLAERQRSRRMSMLLGCLGAVSLIAGWSYYNASEAAKHLEEAQQIIRQEAERARRTPKMKPIEITIPTEVPSSTNRESRSRP